MKKSEIINYLNKMMPKLFYKIENTNNEKIKNYKSQFLAIYNANLGQLKKNELNNLMVEFDQIFNKIRQIEIKG